MSLRSVLLPTDALFRAIAALQVADMLSIRLRKAKAVPLHATNALGGRGCIASTHSLPRHEMGVSGQRYAPATL
jgi:hypothetical protein